MSGPANDPQTPLATDPSPATPTTPPTDPTGDAAIMTPATRQFAIKCAVLTLCLVLAVIVATQAVLILMLHDGAATQSVVSHLTNMGYGIVGALIVIVGGPHILSALIAAIKSSGAA